jgi:hypothetical protein
MLIKIIQIKAVITQNYKLCKAKSIVLVIVKIFRRRYEEERAVGKKLAKKLKSSEKVNKFASN